jgi:hypothetical protein
MRLSHLTTLLGLPFVCLLAARAQETSLFNGHDLQGWQLVATPVADIATVCHVQPDGSITVAGEPAGYLATTSPYRNYRLHAEWRWTGKPGNSGVLVHISSGPRDRVWPLCLQIQTKHGNAGDLLPMAGATFAEPLSTAPGAKTPQLNHSAADSERPAGEWNSCDILCRAGAVEVSINGVLQNRVTGCVPREGRIGFQLEGAPFELRSVRLTPLPD